MFYELMFSKLSGSNGLKRWDIWMGLTGFEKHIVLYYNVMAK